jgi:hypothetical protein
LNFGEEIGANNMEIEYRDDRHNFFSLLERDVSDVEMFPKLEKIRKKKPIAPPPASKVQFDTDAANLLLLVRSFSDKYNIVRIGT